MLIHPFIFYVTGNMSSYNVTGVIAFLSTPGKEKTAIAIETVDVGTIDLSPYNTVLPVDLKVCAGVYIYFIIC